jgi:predicted amidohydrolase
MRVACLQVKAYNLAEAEVALQRILQMIDQAARGGAELIVLPECAYPAYFVWGEQEYAEAGVRPAEEIARIFGGKAKEHGCHIVAGVIQPIEGACSLHNAAVLFGPDGEVIGSTTKSFLWQFDQSWFVAGSQYPVFNTSLGRLGILICADARVPELTRTMALHGAQIIVDCTAWVTNGWDRATMTSSQYEHLIPTRALENGVWVAAASRVGLEADSVLYCGRSCVVDPEGKILVTASTDREEVIFCDVDLTAATGPAVRRRPEAYGQIIQPMESQPIAQVLREQVVPEETVVRVCALQLGDYSAGDAYLRRVEYFLDAVSRQDAQLVVLPGMMPADLDRHAEKSGETMRRLSELAERFGLGLAATLTEHDGEKRYRTCFLWGSGKLLGKYRKVHQEQEGYVAGDDFPVFETPYGRIGMMLDQEGMLPEVARCLMLNGADTVLWPSGSSHWPLRMVARARAEENKVHVALAAPMGEGTALINPMGAIIVGALPYAEQAIAGQVMWMLSRYKEMAPRTNVLWGRMPEAYGALVK